MSSAGLRRLVTSWRDYGGRVVLRVLYSKIAGALKPASALPRGGLPRARSRTLSLLLHTADQSAATVQASVDMAASRAGLDLELCICARVPMAPELATVLATACGTPGIRIVTVDDAISAQTAARWTVEQATGQFVALLKPRALAAPQELLALLSHAQAPTAARPAVAGDMPKMIMLRKADYLACDAGFFLTVPEQVAAMRQTGTRFVYSTECGA